MSISFQGQLSGASLTPVSHIRERARAIRLNVIRQARGLGQGYVGQGLQAADIFAALLFSELNWLVCGADDPRRDHLILSTGHYAIAMYAALAEFGALPAQELDRYAAEGSNLTMGGEAGVSPGIEFSGGSLGQGLGVATGMAWGLRQRGASGRVFCYLSDGELQEGAIWEAAMLAGHSRLANLVAIVDVNRTQADGELVLEVEPVADKFRAFGWWATRIDGNDPQAILDAFAAAVLAESQPRAIICATRLGFPSKIIMEKPFAHFVRVPDAEWAAVVDELQTWAG